MPRIRSRRRLVIGFLLAAVAALWATLMIALYVVQSQYLTVQARVTAKSCHQISGGGYDLGDSTACNLTVSYIAPDGTPNVAQLSGVDSYRIRRAPDGLQTVLVYFVDRSSETPINPQDFVPLWAIVVMGVIVVSLLAVPSAILLRSGFRAAAAAAAGGSSPTNVAVL